LADTERVFRPFLVNVELLRDLLVAHLSTGTAHAGMVEEVIRSAPAGPGRVNRSPDQLVEALTERESVVLRYLDSTFSTAEIAGLLSVSTNTVKTHVKNVYRKLDVSRRRDAVRRGRELGIH